MWVPVGALQALLRPLGLEPSFTRGAPRGKHPAWVDLGYIKSGVGEALDLDQHAWWRRTGEAAGSALGWASGGLGTGAIQPASTMLAGVAERFSRGVSRALGTYQEVLVAVPNVIASHSGRGPYAFALGMYTNSPIAIWGDQILRYGYRKRFARLQGQPFRSYVARDASGATLLKADITVSASKSWRPARLVSGLAAQLRLTSQPLLGHLGRDLFALSRLERDYVAPEQARIVPCQVTLTAAAELVGGLAGAQCAIAPIDRLSPWGAFSVADVPTRVTYPKHLTLADL